VIPVEILVTCTPTPDTWLRELVADPACVTILGETEENAGNLDEGYVADLKARFAGSRKGRQEVGGEILDDGEGALFSAVIFDETRWRKLPALKRIVVAVDPAISTKRRNDDTAVVAAGRGEDDELYLLAARSGKWTPEEWATIALEMKEQTGAECIVGERNRGGDLVASTVRLVAAERARKRGTVSAVKVTEVHATKSKPVRLEEVQTLHEQGRLHSHPDGLPAIEDDACTWDPASGGPSPNGPDAMAWAAFYLFDGWGEGVEEQEKRKREEQVQATRETFKGFTEGQASLGRVAFDLDRA
jgi:phage terminase large subunit-like protein